MRSLSRLIEQDAARRAMPVVTVTTKPVLHGRASADGYVQTVLATCQSQQAGDDIAKISPEMTTISSTKATQLSRTHEEMKEDLMLRRSLYSSAGNPYALCCGEGGLATDRPTRSRGVSNPLGQMHINQAAGSHSL